MRIEGPGPYTPLFADNAHALNKKGAELTQAGTSALNSASGPINLGFAAGDFVLSASVLKMVQDAILKGSQKAIS